MTPSSNYCISGVSTGEVIRYLGEKYTSTMLPTGNMEHEEGNPLEIDPIALDRANRSKDWAEGVHGGARTLTGAALFPVRSLSKYLSSSPFRILQLQMDWKESLGMGFYIWDCTS